jgi:hypothetical protein
MAPTPAPEETARARVYHRRQLALSLLGLVLSVAYLVLLIETRAAAHLARFVARWTTTWWLELAVAVIVWPARTGCSPCRSSGSAGTGCRAARAAAPVAPLALGHYEGGAHRRRSACSRS